MAAAATGAALTAAGLAGCAAGEPATRPWTQPKSEAYATNPPTGSPVRDLTAKRALEEAVANTAEASVHVRGSVTDGLGRSYRIDMRFGQSGSGSSGTISAGESTARVLRVGDEVWIKAPYDFWAAVGGSNFAAEYRNKYVKAPVDVVSFKGLIANTYADKLIARLTKGAGAPAKGKEQSDLDGRPAVPLHTKATGGYGGTVWVSADGAPQLLRIETAGTAPISGSIDFVDYGKRYEPVPPRPEQVAD
ncbi:hypothetical protein [Wenjunlia tyrosinilytica]|jgi:hypothetical protein|uniref:Lipoprotein n=1 Tax=Wenjunlia tyrosinilytica TaxID=1544741 RepID=A0A918DWM0_9ACTN|nr:hypothetical protein [Wenjunlia tyrosinilytica]GGO85888.1 hypothetical protein GCM10012280_20720 [Wenjunlia tyrosinilytica]